MIFFDLLLFGATLSFFYTDAPIPFHPWLHFGKVGSNLREGRREGRLFSSLFILLGTAKLALLSLCIFACLGSGTARA